MKRALLIIPIAFLSLALASTLLSAATNKSYKACFNPAGTSHTQSCTYGLPSQWGVITTYAWSQTSPCVVSDNQIDQGTGGNFGSGAEECAVATFDVPFLCFWKARELGCGQKVPTYFPPSE